MLCIITTTKIAIIPDIPAFNSSPNKFIITPKNPETFNFPCIPDSKTEFKSSSGKVFSVYF